MASSMFQLPLVNNTLGQIEASLKAGRPAFSSLCKPCGRHHWLVVPQPFGRLYIKGVAVRCVAICARFVLVAKREQKSDRPRSFSEACRTNQKKSWST